VRLSGIAIADIYTAISIFQSAAFLY